MQAEADAGVIDVLEEVVGAPPPHDLLGTVAGDGVRGLVPEGDAAVRIDVINPIVKVVQQVPVKIGMIGCHDTSNSFRWRAGGFRAHPLVFGMAPKKHYRLNCSH